HHHTNVVYQPPYNSPYYSGINPYTLGFAMFQDIKRICEDPTEEDKEWFPDIAGSDWLHTLHFACKNFKDESFISQYLSPHLIRELKLFN
ncbi:MAG: SpoVR family protein, partial [Psychrobium sp.]